MSDTTWNLTDDATTYTFDGAESDVGNVTVGEEFSVTLFLEPGGESGGHLTVYNTFNGDYNRYLNDKALDYGLDYEGEPWYRYTLHPNATINSYLFKVEPSAGVEKGTSFWGLLTNVEDESRLVGAGEQLSMTFYVLAESDEYSTRTDVQNALRGDL